MTPNWIILALVLPTFITAARIQLIDITPEEAQKLITQQSLDLRYANKLGEGSAIGRSYNGKIIDSDDFTEETYEANQFHGQDGLGRAIFGYTDNLQSRLEARNANGEVRGQYQYLDPWGNDVQVQYWVDSLGFHQTDNIPKFELQPVTETPEVRKAREEHERAWKEAAKLNGVDPDTRNSYSPSAERLDSENYDTDDDQELEGQVSNQHQSLTRYPALPYSQHLNSDNAKSFGKVIDDDSVIVESTNNNEFRTRFARQQRDEVEEVTSEPRGFFYSFDYQVPFIADHSAGAPSAQASEQVEKIFEFRREENQPLEAVTEIPRESLQIHEKLHAEEEVHDIQESPKQPHRTVSEKIRDGLVVPEEIHDTQVSPKQRRSQPRGSIKFNSKIN